MNNENRKTRKIVKTILFVFLTTTMIIPSINYAFADHDGNTSTWPTDRIFDIHSSLNRISHASFTPATDFVDSANVWNSVSSSWWDFTRNDSGRDVDIGAHSLGWFSLTLAETSYLPPIGGSMLSADIVFNSEIDFRDVNISQGWWSFDYKSVAIHEIGHVAGIHDHSETTGSVMLETLAPNTVIRTLNYHDLQTIRGMY